MPAVSKSQRRFFGMIDHNPEKRKELGISKQAAHDYAATKEAGLPDRVNPYRAKRKKK
jgi:hypothetical protein